MPDRQGVVGEVRRVFGDHLKDLYERLASVDESDAPSLPSPAGRHIDDTALTDIEAATDATRSRIMSDGVTGLRKVIDDEEEDLTADEQIGLEAIVVLEGRPPLFIQNGDFRQTPPEWAVLLGHRERIKASIARVGRIEVSGHPELDWIGTGFLAGANAIVTNRHVAVEFARLGPDGWRFEPLMSASLDFNAEHGALERLEFSITEIIGVHERHDVAVLRLERGGGQSPLPSPLAVASRAPGAMEQRPVYVIGYPAWDGRRNDPDYMSQIFRNIYNVKRLQPGFVTSCPSQGDVFIHDCSTLGGNSGSPVFDLETHQVVGLHFGGRYLSGNNAVPLWKLRDDELLRAADINFG